MCTLVAILAMVFLAIVRVEDIRARGFVALALFVGAAVCLATEPGPWAETHTNLDPMYSDCQTDHYLSALMLLAVSVMYLARAAPSQRPAPTPATPGALGRVMGVVMVVYSVVGLSDHNRHMRAGTLGYAAVFLVVGTLSVAFGFAAARRAQPQPVAAASARRR